MSVSVNVAIFQKCSGLRLSLPSLGNSRKAPIQLATLPEGTNPALMGLKKTLLVCPELDAIKTFQGEVKAWVMARSMPSYFAAGIYLVGNGEIETVNSYLAAAVEKLNSELVPAFVRAYPAAVEAARAALTGGLFNPRDYPTVESLPRRFKIEYDWLVFGTPETLPDSIRAAEAKKLEQRWQEASGEIIQALRVGCLELLRHATDKLTPGEDGKKRVYRDTLITNIQDFLSTFSARNILGDSDLAAVVERVKNVMANVDSPQDLRDSPKLAALVSGQFQKIAAELDGMIQTAPGRRFSLDDGEETAA